MNLTFQVRIHAKTVGYYQYYYFRFFFLLSKTEPIGILSEPQATLNPDKTLTVQFQLNSCKKYWISVWIRISLRNELMILRSRKNSKAKDDSHLVLQVPKECFNQTGDEYSITLPSKAKAPCTFPLARLMECKVYNVEIIPIYVSLQGQPSIVEITVPPQVNSISHVFHH
jgi:hypothetical protein